VKQTAQRGVDWFLWRLATSSDIPEGIVEIRRSYSFRDALHAHLVLDALRDIRRRARPRKRKPPR